MKRKTFLLFALLITLVQGSWAQIDISNAIIYNIFRFLNYDGKDLYDLYTDKSVVEVYAYNDGWKKLKLDVDYSVHITNSDGEEVNEVKDKGTYILVAKGLSNTYSASGGYSGEVSQTFYVVGKGDWINHRAESFSQIDNDSRVITITNEEELALLAWEFFYYYYTRAPHSGWTFRLARDLDLTAYYWTPIGSNQAGDESAFFGHFDGQGHTIKGMHIRRLNSNEHHEYFYPQGMFAFVQTGSSIKNLTLTESEIESGYNKGVGAIAGYLNNGTTIQNCHVTSSVNVICTSGNNDEYGGDAYGGIAGYSSADMRGCTSAAHIFKQMNTSGCEAFGGIVGRAVFTSSSGTLTNCVYLGDQVFADKQMGALIGYLHNNEGKTIQGFYSSTILKGCNGTDLNGISPVEELFDQADNTSFISNASQSCNVVLKGRTFFHDSNWNTLCLPFNVRNFNGTPLEGAIVKTLSSATFEDGTLTLTFSGNLTAIEAGKPYIVKWTSGNSVVHPVFTGVTMSTISNNIDIPDVISFKGTTSPHFFIGEHKSILYLGDNNTLYYPNGDLTIGSCHAYFELADGITAGTLSNSNIKSIVLNLGDEEMGITTTNLTNQTDKAEAWYSITDGRKLVGKPEKKGIYVHGRKKIIVQ